MNTTKRKFNALIQSIGTRSPQSTPAVTTPAEEDSSHRRIESSSSSLCQPATSTMSTYRPIDPPAASPTPLSSISADFLAKRRRVGAGTPSANISNSGDGNPSTPSPGKTTITNITLRKYTSGGKVETTETQFGSPSYCPSDREQLIKRLATFQELTEWTPKPDPLNEIGWAKRGWVCSGKERVRCTLCSKELVVKIIKTDNDGKEVAVAPGSELEEALVNKLTELIVGAHQDGCLWRKTGCDDALLRLSLTSPQIALPSLRQRYDELCGRTAFLPYMFNLRLPQSFKLQTIKSQLPPNFFTEPSPPQGSASQRANDVALALALTGWQGLNNDRIGPVPNSATCATCQRRLGLWMFKSREVDEATSEILVPAPMDHLDPIREHRFFCPWRNPAAQRHPGSKTSTQETKPAWEILLATVRNAAHLRGPSRETTKKRFPTIHGRSKSSIIPLRRNSPTPTSSTTPTRNARDDSAVGAQDGQASPPMTPDIVDEQADEAQREAEEKTRWARLRRVKSLFDTKNGKRLRRLTTISRPGSSASRPSTAKSTATTEEVADKAGQTSVTS